MPSSALLLVERSRYHRGDDAQPASLSGGGEGEKATERGGAGCGPLSWHSIAMVALFPYPYPASLGEKQQEDVGLSRATQTRFLSGESACKDMVWADGGETARRGAIGGNYQTARHSTRRAVFIAFFYVGDW